MHGVYIYLPKDTSSLPLLTTAPMYPSTVASLSTQPAFRHIGRKGVAGATCPCQGQLNLKVLKTGDGR